MSTSMSQVRPTIADRIMRSCMLPVFASVLLLTACIKPEEPITCGSYHFDNRAEHVLHLAIAPHWNDFEARRDSIPPDTLLRFMDVTQGSCGHVLPGNFIKRFTVTRTDSLLGVVYEGVRNGDWDRADLFSRRTDLVLVVE
jgi:hypothetical protein